MASKSKAATAAAAPTQESNFPAFATLVKALEATLKLEGVSQRGLGRKAGMSDGNIRRALTQGSGISNESWLRLAAATPEGSPLRKALAGHELPTLAAEAHDVRHDGVIYVPFNRLRENPDNYRKTFDEAAIEELASSIAAKGLLQNLVVFPADAGGIHTINSGSRRYRAVALLVSRQQLPADYLLPVLPMDMSEAEGRALAIVENLQRVDVSPLEEADGFRALRDLGWPTEQIAESVGLAQRTVQDRLQLSERLFAPAREALATKRITLDQARAIVTAPTEDLQGEMLGWATHAHRPETAEELRRHVRSTLPKLSDADFDPSLYTGELMGDGKERLCVDREQFAALQEAHAEKLLAELGAKWKRAERVSYFYAGHYRKEDDPEKGGAYVCAEPRCPWKVTVHEGYVSLYDDDDAEGDDESEIPDDTEAWEREQAGRDAERAARRAANAEFAGKFRDAMIRRPDMVIRLALISMLSSEHIPPFFYIETSSGVCVPERLARAIADNDDEVAQITEDGLIEDVDMSIRAWERIVAMPEAEVQRLFALTLTEGFVSGAGTAATKYGRFSQLIAADLGIEVPSLLRDEYEAPVDASKNDEPDEEAEGGALMTCRACGGVQSGEALHEDGRAGWADPSLCMDCADAGHGAADTDDEEAA